MSLKGKVNSPGLQGVVKGEDTQDKRVSTSVQGTPNVSSEATTRVKPSLSDYFQWRQQQFQPLHHWPMQEDAGADRIEAMTDSPDGVFENEIITGVDGPIRPKEQYKAAERPDSVNNRLRLDGFRPTFPTNGKPWTLVCWFRTFGGNHICDNTWGVDGGEGPGMRFTCGTVGGRIIFNARDPDNSLSQFSFLRLDLDRNHRDLTLPTHLAVRCDGMYARIILNGEVRGSVERKWIVKEGEPGHDLTLMAPAIQSRGGKNHMSGFILDDRCWSESEIKADYERGAGAIHLRTMGDSTFRTIFPVSEDVDAIRSLDPYRYWDWRAQGEQDGDITPSLINQTGEVETVRGRSDGYTVSGSSLNPSARKERKGQNAWGNFSRENNNDNGQYWYRTDTDKLHEWKWLPEEGGSVFGALRYNHNDVVDMGHSTVSWWGQYYGWSVLAMRVVYVPENESAELRVYDGDALYSMATADPGILTPDDHDSWVTLGHTWNDDEVTFWKNGEVWSSHEYDGVVGKDMGNDDRLFSFCIGSHRAGRWPWYGDIGPVAIWQRDVTEEEAQTFHEAAIPDL